jgi:hypothetical protein
VAELLLGVPDVGREGLGRRTAEVGAQRLDQVVLRLPIIRRSPASCASRQATGRVRPESKVARSCLFSVGASIWAGGVLVMAPG